MEDAVNALQAFGDAAGGALEAAMRDPATEFIVRSAIIEVLGRIATPRTVRILAEELEYGTEELDTRSNGSTTP